jgi:hypothetical protein
MLEKLKVLDSVTSNLTKKQDKVIYDYMIECDVCKGNDLCYMEYNNSKEFEDELEKFPEEYSKKIVKIKRAWYALLKELGIEEGEKFIVSYWW